MVAGGDGGVVVVGVVILGLVVLGVVFVVSLFALWLLPRLITVSRGRRLLAR